MDQKKIGTFLKELRKEKGITQEELAEHLNVSNRSVSRWETGSNMPDISLLTDIADFYDVDVREIIEGERKNNMNEELREVADKMADYAHNEKSRLLRVIQVISIIGVVISVVLIVLLMKDCNKIENFSVERTFSTLASLILLVIMSVLTLYVTGILRKLVNNKVVMTVITVLTAAALAYGVIRIFAVYLIMGMFALTFYASKIKVYDDVSKYSEFFVSGNEKYSHTQNDEMFEIFPESVDGLDVKEFQYMYYNPWDAQYITYLTVSYDEAAFADEMERLSNIGVEDYTQYYNVTGEPSGYDICAMDSDEYYGFVYAIIPENSESREITYVGIWFCNYFLDVDVHDYMKDEYLLEGFDASNDNPYRKDKIKYLEELSK